MSAPFLTTFLGLRRAAPNLPNISDAGGVTSIAIAREMFRLIGVTQPEPTSAAGTILEQQVAIYLGLEMARLAPHRTWFVMQKGRKLSDFVQYTHLATLQKIINEDKTNTLAIAIGRDYEVKPDVTIGLDVGLPKLMLHACVSCKLTLRSDRAQNVRTEAAILARHRRGRQPHIVAVTAEPLPTRLASLARGTGDVDAVYHVALEELKGAVASVGTKQQQAVLDEMIGQDRLLDFDLLATNLVV